MTGSVLTLEEARALPKVLLHDHLDGGLRVATILELADNIGWTLPTTDPDDLQAWFTRGAETGDLLQYLATFEHTLAVMQTADAIERIAHEAVVDLADDGVVYAEVRFAPELHQGGGLALEAVVEAVTSGFRRGERTAAESGRVITVNAICCAMRTEHRSLEIAHLVDRLRAWDDKVVAFDLAGAETGFPPSLHADALAFARSAHLNITIHASEPPDLELISDALAHGAHRIGHGVRLRADTSLVDGDGDGPGALRLGPLAQHVLDRQIHLEMAPTCNVQIGAVPTVADHPIGPFLRAGFSVGINTDNRLMSNVRPSTELVAVAEAFDLTHDEMGRLAVNAMMASFAPMATRRALVGATIAPAYRSPADSAER
ncbi:MAG TPA: adenosine deaminase [Ilumatobacteraceae bacterium]|nr:adenosine deaminase [Ilumatobacteraceae bacterium]